MNSQQPILSIVVPSYNRSSKVVDMVQAVLAAQLNVELVVVDNCSDVEHVERLKTINAPNFKLILREKNIGGLANPLDALNYSSGIFTMLCLDKDCVDAKYLGAFIELLVAHPELVYGQCALNATKATTTKWHAQGLGTILRDGYNCHHPSGFFARTETLIATGIVSELLLHNLYFSFNIDIIKTHLAMQGKGCYVNTPLVHTETLDQSAKECSHTYSGENIWFLPGNVFKRMVTFIDDVQTLGLNKNQQRRIIIRLYRTHLHGATLEYRRIMGSDSLCAHHGLFAKNIGIGKMFCEHYRFAKSFFKTPISKFWSIFIVSYGAVRWTAHLILGK